MAWKDRDGKQAVREAEGDGSGRVRGQLESYRMGDWAKRRVNLSFLKLH